MKHVKQLIILFTSLFIALSPIAECSFCYADNVPGGSGGAWDPIETHEDIVAAFKAYCQTTGLNTDHVPDTINAIVKWDYSQLEKYAALANVDLDGLNAHIWYQVQQNKPLKFYFDSTGVTSCQKIYSEIISDNDIQPNTTKRVYNGKYFEDSDGNKCFCYIINDNTTNQSYSNTNTSVFNANIIKGTYYRFLGRAYYSTHAEGNYPYQLRYRDKTYNYNIRVNKDNPGYNVSDFCKLTLSADDGTSYNQTYSFYMDTPHFFNYSDGCVCIIYNPKSNKYYLGTTLSCKTDLIGPGITDYNVLYGQIELKNMLVDDSTVDYSQGDEVEHPEDKSMEVTTGDTTINNYITNNNSTVTNNYYDDDDPPNYTNPYNDNPTGTTIDPDGNINFQMPDLNVDWNLDFGEDAPFPFSIPFDIIHFLNAFNSEPVTPHIEETITIANMDFDIDIDLEWLDDVAGYFRTFILLSYVIGLIVATRALFHIY